MASTAGNRTSITMHNWMLRAKPTDNNGTQMR